MAIDTSIYGQIQPMQPVQNPLAQLGQLAQLQHYQAQAGKSQRDEERQNRLYGLVASPEFAKMDAQGKAGALQGVGAFDEAGKVVTSNAAANKDTRAAEQTQLEMAIKRNDALSGAMQRLSQNPNEAPMVLKQMVDSQIIAPDYAQKIMQGAQGAPDAAQFFAAGAQAAVSAKDQLAQQIQKQGQAIQMRGQDMSAQTAVRGQDLSAATATAGQGVTMRGQDMTDARARETATAGGVPSGYRRTADGALEFIPGGPADPASKAGGGKPLTEGQSKALLFGTRMQEANGLLEGLAEQGVDRPGVTKRIADAVPTMMGGRVLSAGANALQSAPQQQVEQAQRDFINAALRRESGAVISDAEFENARQQYFPQINDKPENIAQKKRNRELATRGILEEVPDAEARIGRVRGSPEAPAAKASAGGTAAPKSKAEFDALPSGALFKAPDGTMRRKP